MSSCEVITYKDIPLWKDVTQEEWDDWRWHMRRRIRTLKDLSAVISLKTWEERDIAQVLQRLPMAVTPYFAFHIRRLEESGQMGDAEALKRTVKPDISEITTVGFDTDDGVGEELNRPTPCVSQFYDDRVLLSLNNLCSVYCRYCFRKRKVGRREEFIISEGELRQAIDYIRKNTNIRDVILSGGDPLSMPDVRLREIISEIRSIEHVYIIRIDTKFPVSLPQRITDDLVSMLKEFHPLFMTLHFTHPGELSPETKEKCEKLADAGIPLGTYTPLLKGVNDDKEILKRLFLGLIRVRVRPYYLVHFIETKFAHHFKTSIVKGLEILDGLHGYISGYALPQYVVYLPEGGGKVPIQPDYIDKQTTEGYWFRNPKGEVQFYPDPTE